MLYTNVCEEEGLGVRMRLRCVFPVGPEVGKSELLPVYPLATVSGVVAPNPSLTDIGAGISTSAVNSTSGRELFPVGILVPVFRRNFGFPVPVT